jgi:dATP pyrophosphohydrolase
MDDSGRYKIPESVLVVIHSPALEVLLIRRADVGDSVFWQSVTGSKDRRSDTFAATAAREVAEETGIDCRPGAVSGFQLQDWQLENRYAIYPQWLHRYPPETVENTERVFGLEVPRDIAIRLNPAEHLDWCWLPWLEAADACFAASNAEAILQLPQRRVAHETHGT